VAIKALSINKKAGKKLIMYWGNSVSDFKNGNIKEGAGFLVMQYYPESLSVSRDAEYENTSIGFGVGDVLSWNGTSGLSFDGLNCSFSRDMSSDELLWSNNYNYDVEFVISLLYSFLLPNYDGNGGIKALPPMVWFDFGYDIFGYGGGNGFKDVGVSRFYITSLSHEIQGVFPDTKKIRAVSFDIGVQETVYYEGKIRSSRFSERYRANVKKRSKNRNNNMKNYVEYNFG